MTLVRLLAPSVLAGITVMGASVDAHGSPMGEPDRVGWWSEANVAPGPLGALVVPPDAPPDGLYLAAGPVGAVTESAVHFTGVPSNDATLILRATDRSFSTTTPVVACPAAGPWEAAFGGEWSTRPARDCGRANGGVDGVPASDGTSMTWDLGAAFKTAANEFDIVLIPQGPAPFKVPVHRPGAGALLTTDRIGPSPTTSAYRPGDASLSAGPSAATSLATSKVPPLEPAGQLDVASTPSAPSTGTDAAGLPVSAASRSSEWRRAWLWMFALIPMALWRYAGTTHGHLRRRLATSRPIDLGPRV